MATKCTTRYFAKRTRLVDLENTGNGLNIFLQKVNSSARLLRVIIVEGQELSNNCSKLSIQKTGNSNIFRNGNV